MGYGDTRHTPVLVEEIIGLIGVRAEGYYCDATVGGGGFAQQLIDRLAGGKLVCLDTDPGAIENLRGRWEGDARVELVRANFSRISEVWKAGGWPSPDGIVYDLGFSSIQLEDAARGLSFQADSPLDMRLDPEEETATAAEIVNSWDVMDLSRLFWRHGETAGGRIARRIVKEREVSAIETTGRLAAIVSAAAGKKKARGIRRPRFFSRSGWLSTAKKSA